MARKLLDDPARAGGSSQLGVGAALNDGTGDELRTGGSKLKAWASDLNDMLKELFSHPIHRRVDLANFESIYAHPGEKVVFSGTDWASNPPSQAQRRKNARILLEACLYANGGTGHYDGHGWYTTSGTTRLSFGGIVHIQGPLVIEPYADSEYFPFFATADTTQRGATTRGWTLPGGITITGNGGTPGYTDTWSESTQGGSRLIGYGAPAAQFYGGAGPTATGTSPSRHISFWRLRGIGLARIGDTSVASVANPVLRAANWHVSGTIYGNNIGWNIEDVHIDLQPGTSAYRQVGFLNQCGLDCKVPSLRIHGHRNPGWCLVQTGTFNGTAKVQPSTTVHYGTLLCNSSKRGVLISEANFFCDRLDMEPTGMTDSQQQLVFGDNCQGSKIGYLWMEGCYPPDSGTVTGADHGLVVAGGNDSEWNPNYGVGTYTRPGPISIEDGFLSGYAGSKPDYAICGNSCQDLKLGTLNTANFAVAVMRWNPSKPAGAVGTFDPGYLNGSYDSSKIQWGGTPALIDDDTDYSLVGLAWSSGMIDRALAAQGRATTKPNKSSRVGGLAVVGEKVLHSAPVPGGPTGWVCTTGGDYPTAQYWPYGASWIGATQSYTLNINNNSYDTVTVTVTGAALGDHVWASLNQDTQGVEWVAWVSAADTVKVRFYNRTGGTVTLSAGTIYLRLFKHD